MHRPTNKNQTSSLALVASALFLSAACSLGGELDAPVPQDPDPSPAPEDPAPDSPNAQPPAEGEPTIHSILNGSFVPFTEFANSPVDGRVQLTRSLDGSTQVDLVATGLAPRLPHSVHVHALPCEFGGGGHYKIDPAIAEVRESNEVWPMIEADTRGIGRSSITVAGLLREDAMSVVIHSPAGQKLACADLLANDDGVHIKAGSIVPLPGVSPIDQNISGSATLATTGISTKIDMSITGLNPAASYVSHAHALPCEVLAGGPHYKIDPLAELTDMASIRANELWPEIGAHPQGAATVGYTKAHNARYDAQSIVIHRVINNQDKPKVACANLTRARFPAGFTSGSAVLMDAGQDRLDQLTATAEMTRRLDGISVVSMNATGLEPNGRYAVHVHNLPCDVDSGGGHYTEDSSEDDVSEENELWLELLAGPDRSASATNFTAHVVRAEATSLVIHDPTDGARLACVDLH